MKKLKGAAREKATKDAKQRLRAEGLDVHDLPGGGALKVAAPSGRRYVYYAHMDRWYQTGRNPKQFHGLEAMLQRERDLARNERELDGAWAKLSPRVTVFTDAGYCCRTKCASWGAWVKADGEKSISAGGEMDGPVSSSTEAEIRGGANAFSMALSRGIIQRGDVVIWQCDNVASLSWLLALYPHSRDRAMKGGLHAHAPRANRPPSKVCVASEGAQRFAKLCRDNDLRVLVRHVRGHQPGSHRQWVNRLCDEIAAHHLKNRRARFYEKETAE